ncbi:glycosyltransferase [Cellulosimicrobium cellulans]|uniref:glycosyltransferase n=1 Tax=Cellulosimicrobium cellulans TaxID=1710 RepID=UPI0019659775|nr:glycosyltransferase [Cellulosimicrobium cellulans]MBN0040981.1 glycosyltransferase [Cellulosimicrobium cellulans]
MTTVQNVVFPTDLDKLPLYVESPRDATSSIDLVSRRSARLIAGSEVSFASYFNAFPLMHWAANTSAGAVTLVLELSGRGQVRVVRTDARGQAARLDAVRFEGEETVRLSVPTAGAADGGWCWFELTASSDVELISGRWEVDAVPAEGTVTVAITTFNKPDYCVRTLGALGADDDVLAVLDRVVVVDQGTQKVAAESGFADAQDGLQGRLHIVDQPNLGGSGGFSRGMIEAMAAGSTHVMLLDDDVAIEPESIFRAVRFADACSRPTIVGGHMFDMYRPTNLHAVSEIVQQSNFMWGPADPDHRLVDFSEESLRATRWLHRRPSADYNGWWMCLVPTAVVREIGLSMPYFIKWDDAEYGLRAKSAGVPTVSLPGVALWHITWQDKDDAIDWQAYFHARNRIVSGLLHSVRDNGGALLADSSRLNLKHLLSMQYYAATLRNTAIRDVLQGPDQLHASMGTRLGELRAMSKGFGEARTYTAEDPAPPAAHGDVPPSGRDRGPRGVALALFTLRAIARQLVVPVSAEQRRRPDAQLERRQAVWWELPRHDSVLVLAGENRTGTWYRRDRRAFVSLGWESMRLHRELRRRWPALQEAYRGRADELVSPRAWRETIGIVAGDD